MGTPQKVLVLQGGGALGAYQAGVFEGLHAERFDIDWVVGTSIGAINGAIIAGNEPPLQLARLQEFWSMVSQVGQGWSSFEAAAPYMGLFAQAMKTAPFFLQGIAGFYRPVPFPAPAMQGGSFYDTSPLEATLQKLVDFDYLNDGGCRYTSCAVDAVHGKLAVFDTRHLRVEPKHVMASAALPPGFPSITIDGVPYWDGGIYSNTPIDVVLDDAERRDTVCIMVDLWDAKQAFSNTIPGIVSRQKDIQYASRIREHLRQHHEMQNLRRAIYELSSAVPADAMTERLKRLAGKGCPSYINLTRLIMKALPGDDHLKDVDFSRGTVAARWQMGLADGRALMLHDTWLGPLPDGVSMAIHELARDR